MAGIRFPAGALGVLLVALILTLVSLPARAEPSETPIGLRELRLVDESRGIKAAMGFAGSDTRRIDVKVWYPGEGTQGSIVRDAPIADGAPWPLVVYSHGTFGHADNAMHIVRALVRAGYVVAAPDYPLSSSKAFTKIRFADISDVSEQVRDVRFVIDKILADPVLRKAIDPEAIGVTGHSLGAVTSYFATYGEGIRDPRIKAMVSIAGGDPVQTALTNDMGLLGTQHAAVSVPVLFLSADRDLFARMTGRPHAAYARVEPPRYELLIHNGVHVWFRDGNEQPAGNKNPDCLFFEANAPGIAVPGCEERVPLIGPAKQQELTRTAMVSFFDAYLKDDKAALERLRAMGKDGKDATLIAAE